MYVYRQQPVSRGGRTLAFPPPSFPFFPFLFPHLLQYSFRPPSIPFHLATLHVPPFIYLLRLYFLLPVPLFFNIPTLLHLMKPFFSCYLVIYRFSAPSVGFIRLKGQCHEIFDFWFLSLICFPQAPEYTIRAVSNLFENSRTYSQFKVHHRCP